MKKYESGKNTCRSFFKSATQAFSFFSNTPLLPSRRQISTFYNHFPLPKTEEEWRLEVSLKHRKGFLLAAAFELETGSGYYRASSSSTSYLHFSVRNGRLFCNTSPWMSTFLFSAKRVRKKKLPWLWENFFVSRATFENFIFFSIQIRHFLGSGIRSISFSWGDSFWRMLLSRFSDIRVTNPVSLSKECRYLNLIFRRSKPSQSSLED